jgi:hypothetical protein
MINSINLWFCNEHSRFFIQLLTTSFHIVEHGLDGKCASSHKYDVHIHAVASKEIQLNDNNSWMPVRIKAWHAMLFCVRRRLWSVFDSISQREKSWKLVKKSWESWQATENVKWGIFFNYLVFHSFISCFFNWKAYKSFAHNFFYALVVISMKWKTRNENVTVERETETDFCACGNVLVMFPFTKYEKNSNVYPPSNEPISVLTKHKMGE